VVDVRIQHRLRSQEGKIYSAGANVELYDGAQEAGVRMGSYRFKIAFGCSPGDVDQLLAATREELSKLRSGGLDPELFDAVISGARTPRKIDWRSELVETLRRGANPGDILKRQSIVSDVLTRESMGKAAGRYLDTGSLMTFVQLPAKGHPGQ
jgi:hypothetical protein